MLYQTKAATQSVTFVAQLLAILIIIAKMSGVDISEDVAGLPDKLGAAVDTVAILVLELTALYGRLRAKAQITGLFKAK
jgi:hypothetical protein